MFDRMPELSVAKKTALDDELIRYLSNPTEKVSDARLWWIEKRAVYPRLSRMALDYLSIPGILSFLFIFLILFSNSNKLKQPPSMSNVFLAKDDSFFLMCAIAYQSSQHVHSFALAHGADWASSTERMSRRRHLCLI
jgi:hAT family C-terminal dimerisation region